VLIITSQTVINDSSSITNIKLIYLWHKSTTWSWSLTIRVVTNSYTVRREKAKSFPTDPRSLSDLEIPQEWTLTSDGKPFLIHDGSADSSERMLVFASEVGLTQLA